MRLYLVRHPKPLVAADTCYGCTDLTVSAEEHARVLALLTPNLPEQTSLFCSPLQRCAVLADSLAEALDCAPAIHDARLAEMYFGDWEMRAWSDIPRIEIDAWANDIAQFRPGGGENVLQMAQRVSAFHDDLLRCGQDRAIVICHAGTMRLLLACQRGLPLAEMARYAARTPHKIAYGELMILDC